MKSTFALCPKVLSPLTDNATPNVEALMSAAVHVSPHKSELLPYDAVASAPALNGQTLALARSVVLIAPPLIIRTLLSVAILYFPPVV